MTLASDAIDWIDRSMPPSMMTKVTPVARMNSTAVSLASCSSVAGCEEAPAAIVADQDDQHDQGAQRQPLAQPVGSSSVCSCSHASHHVSDQVDLPRLVARRCVGVDG